MSVCYSFDGSLSGQRNFQTYVFHSFCSINDACLSLKEFCEIRQGVFKKPLDESGNSSRGFWGVSYSVFIIVAGLMLDAFRICHQSVPMEMMATSNKASTKMPALIGALTTKSAVYW